MLQRLHQAQGDDATGPFATDLPNRRATHVVPGLADDAAGPFTLLTLARKLLDPVLQRNPRRIGLLVAGFAPEQARRAAEAPFAIDCWLALAQNDIVTACNGTTVEVMHTDTEGRMVLADTLALASRERPRLIVDYATLTGACVYALGTRYSGAFTNRDGLVPEIIAAGRASGERVWPFPLDDDYDQALESDIADIKQCTLEGEADHIPAARFLRRFVGDRAWLHIDLSACTSKGGLAHVPTDVTGFGVRFTLNLLLDRGIMNRGLEPK